MGTLIWGRRDLSLEMKRAGLVLLAIGLTLCASTKDAAVAPMPAAGAKKAPGSGSGSGSGPGPGYADGPWLKEPPWWMGGSIGQNMIGVKSLNFGHQVSGLPPLNQAMAAVTKPSYVPVGTLQNLPLGFSEAANPGISSLSSFSAALAAPAPVNSDK